MSNEQIRQILKNVVSQNCIARLGPELMVVDGFAQLVYIDNKIGIIAASQEELNKNDWGGIFSLCTARVSSLVKQLDGVEHAHQFSEPYYTKSGRMQQCRSCFHVEAVE